MKPRNLFLNPRKGEVESFDVGEVCEEWIKIFGLKMKQEKK